MTELAATTGVSRAPRAAARLVLRVAVLAIAPAVLAGVYVVYLVPTPEDSAQSGVFAALASLAARSPVGLFAGLLVLFAALLHFWWADAARRWPFLAERAPTSRAAGRAVVAWVVLLGVAAVGGWLGRERFFGAYEVLSSSMLPSLEPRDFVAGNKLAYGFGLLGPRDAARAMPQRGDVVVFANPSPHGPRKIVKRVIGLPGDAVAMRAGVPVINGRDVPICDVGAYAYAAEGVDVRGRLVMEALEDGPTYLTVQTPLRVAFTHTYRVRPGEVFVLGDNRNNSADSRAWGGGRGGGLPVGAIEARADRVLVGHDRSGRVDVRRLLASIGMAHNMDGVDLEEIERGLERCGRRLRVPTES